MAGFYGTADGAGSAARFSNPNGVSVDSAGNLYVADYYFNTIRKGCRTPWILNFSFTGGQFGLNLSGSPGQSVVVEASTDLATWLPLRTDTFGAGRLSFSDPQSSLRRAAIQDLGDVRMVNGTGEGNRTLVCMMVKSGVDWCPSSVMAGPASLLR
jgi:hypothetical protein